MQGLSDVAKDAAERGVGFVVRRHPDNSLEAFIEEVEAALVMGDENPCREPERWRRVLAKRLKIPFWTVDADVVVPSRCSAATLSSASLPAASEGGVAEVSRCGGEDGAAP